MQKQDAMGTKAYSSQGQAQAASDQRAAAAKQASDAKYNTTFASEPSVRPSYIPNDYSRGGVTYHVVYHDNGYGYYNGNIWVALAAADLMGYYNTPVVVQQPVVQTMPQTGVVHHSGGHGVLLFFTILIILGVAAGIFYLAMRSK